MILKSNFNPRIQVLQGGTRINAEISILKSFIHSTLNYFQSVSIVILNKGNKTHINILDCPPAQLV